MASRADRREAIIFALTEVLRSLNDPSDPKWHDAAAFEQSLDEKGFVIVGKDEQGNYIGEGTTITGGVVQTRGNVYGTINV